MRSSRRCWAAGAALAGLGLVAGAGFAADAQHELPSFRLRNWDGREIDTGSIGAPTIVVPTYAKCVYACPMVTFLLSQLDEELGSPKDVRYLHISINPSADTSEEILLHFAKHDIDPVADPRWLFVNGPQDAIEGWIEASGIEIRRTVVEGGTFIDHDIRVFVLGTDGSTVASFDTYFWPSEEMRDALEIRTAD